MIDSRERFTETVQDYDRYRPDYPAALGEWLLSEVPAPADVVDLGAGTGISTRMLAALGYAVVGVEPNPAMRARAAVHGGRYVAGEAAATGLAAGAYDLVFAAQAFHWFDLDRTLPECRRVLRHEWFCVAAWNLRVEAGFSAAYDAVLRDASTTFSATPTGHDTIAELRAHPLVRDAELFEFPHAQALDLAGVLGRAGSSSYVRHGVADMDRFNAAMTVAFEAHAVDGVVTLDYRTLALRWR